MKIACPECSSENDSASAYDGQINCGCGNVFFMPSKAAAIARSAALRRQGNIYSIAAKFFLSAGVLLFLIYWPAACGTIAFAFGVELISQIIYIRANTEK